ncbi:hypothetical protein N8716_00045 [Pontimonas sp.]|nr:hypothetical protein [Pontimonas sp.]
MKIQNPITALLPCRKGSLRVPDKNTRSFGPTGESLLEIKLRQLVKLTFVAEVVISTNDSSCIATAVRIDNSKIRIDERPSYLCSDTANISDLGQHLGALCSTDYFLWTHVTSPFFSVDDYALAYESFLWAKTTGFESLIAVESLRDFFLYEGKPLNFGAAGNFWPRSQDLEVVHRVTSAAFIGKSAVLAGTGERMREPAFLFPTTGPAALDIDWQDDFDQARDLAAAQPSLLL